MVITVPKKLVKRLLVGTVPQKNSEEVICRNSPTKKEEVIGRNSSNKKIVKRLFKGTVPQKGKRLLVGTVLQKKIVKRLLVGTVQQKK